MILKELRAVRGKLDKERILAKADTFDKKMFYMAYNPDLTYGVTYNYIHWEGVRPFNQWDEVLLNKLARRDLVGNGAREEIQKHCNEHGDLVKLICNKDLDCGVTGTTLNKVFGKGFVPLFEVQLAQEVPLDKITFPMVGQIKYNGVRVIAHIRKGDVTYRTRNGKTFEFPKLTEALLHGYKCYDREVILDGELAFGDSRKTNHAAIAGIVNSAIRGTPIADISNTIVYTVFDFMEASDFFNQECRDKYEVRYSKLENFLTMLSAYVPKETWEKLAIAHSFGLNSFAEAQAKFNEVVQEGYEGLILKSWGHLYTFKRNDTWIKLKETKSCDLTVVGFQDGKDKFEGGIGALVCSGEVEGRLVNVEVGVFIGDENQRFKDRGEYSGKTVEVLYNSVIRDSKTGDWSLFLPRFSHIRGDK